MRASSEHDSPDRLDSWKEIAAHLGRSVLTAQRWEKSEGLPVHRHAHEKQSSVYAFKSEVDQWWRDRGVAAPAKKTTSSRRAIIAAVVLVVTIAPLAVW
jgi:hypothetical protein